MIKAILFDLDGTLLDTNELIYKAFCTTFKEVLGMVLPKGEITNLYGKPLKDSFANYTEDKQIIENLIKAHRNYNDLHHDDMCQPFNGVLELLTKLKEKGIKCGVVTSKRKNVAIHGMTLGKIIEFMDIIISPEDTKKHKPDGEPAMTACEFLGIEPKESIMVGDSPYDLICGKNAGCFTCGVEYTTLNINELLKVEPTYMIKNPLDILKLI